jgi:hypothetical protein
MEHEASGLSAKVWCEQNGIKPNLFYYWKHTLSHRDNPTAEDSWLPAVLCDEAADAQPCKSGIIIRFASAEVEVHNDCSPELLRCVLSALKGRSC